VRLVVETAIPLLKRLALLLSFLAVTVAPSAAEEFALRERREQAPEMGELLSYILIVGKDAYSFVPPTNWRVSLDTESRQITFRAPDGRTSMSLQVTGPNPGLQSGIKAEVLRAQLARRFSDALLLEEFPCYTSTHTGRGFQLQWNASAEVPMLVRIAYFGTARTAFELTLLEPAQMGGHSFAAFGALLTSFQKLEELDRTPP
jgi:hypothetical protein